MKNITASQLLLSLGLTMAVIIGVGGEIMAAKPTSSTETTSTNTKIPSEFIARIYGDALGRIPDQGGWNYHSNAFASSGCSSDTLAGFARTVYKSDEFANLYTDNAPKLYTLYRGALSQEPTSREYDRQLRDLNSGATTWAKVVDSVTSSTKFKQKASEICDQSKANYSYSGTPFAFGGTYSQSTLQSALDSAAPGDIVTVPQKSLITLSSTLNIPYGVTLKTDNITGITGRRPYANMARFVRSGDFTGDLLNIWAGAKVENVWVDGLKAQNQTVKGGVNFLVRPTKVDRSWVKWVRGDNPLGAQNIRVFGREGGDPENTGNCAGGIDVIENFIGNWANNNRISGSHWSDGVGSACSHTAILNNEVIDGSDVPIILWRSDSLDPQASLVEGNLILNAGNDAFGGLAADPGAPSWYDGNQSTSFVGATFRNNTLWTGSQVHYVIGLNAGTRAWSFLSPYVDGSGGSYSGNNSGISRVRTQIPIYASGLFDTYVSDNWDLTMVDYVNSGDGGHAPANTCPSAQPTYNPAHASGTLPGLVTGDYDGCI